MNYFKNTSFLIFTSILFSHIVLSQTFSPVTWTDLTKIDTVNNTLLKTSSYGGWDASAHSQNTLFSTKTGIIKLIVDTTNVVRCFGFNSFPNATLSYTDIDYCFYMYGTNTLWIGENNSQKYLGTYSIGDTLTLSRTTDTIYYRRNGSILRKTAVSSSSELHIEASILTANMSLEPIECTFEAKRFELNFDVTNVTEGNSDGAIDLSVSGGEGNYTYSWSPGGMTTQDISYLSAGIYTITVTDDSSNTITKEVAVGYSPEWTDFYYADTIGGDTLVNTSPYNSLSLGHANSQNVLFGNRDGWIEYTVSDLSGRTIGFTIPPDESSYWTSKDYGFRLQEYVQAIKDKQLNGHSNPVQIGDVIRIERIKDTMYYRHNESIHYQVPVDASEDLMIDVNLVSSSIKLYDFRCSFASKQLELDFSVTNVTLGNSDGAVDLTVAGGEGNYTYSWSPGGMTTQDISNLSPGIYTVTVTDDSSNTITREVAVGYSPEWTDFYYADTIGGDTLVNTSPYNSLSLGHANSQNVLFGNRDGWIEYTVSDLSGRTIGFTIPPDESSYWTSKDYGFRLQEYVQAIEGKQLNGHSNPVQIGDVIRIERIKDTMYYRHNESIHHQIPVDASEDLMIDVNLLVKDIKLYDFRCSFTTKQIELTFDVTNVTEGNNDGAVDLTVAGGEGNYAYSWSPGGMTTQDISNLSPGIYTVTVTDDSSNTITREVAVGYSPEWTDFYYADTIGGDTLVNTSPYNSLSLGHANSKNILFGGKDGWIEYTISNILGRTIGLTVYPSNDVYYSSKDYGFNIRDIVKKIEKGILSSWNPTQIGDIVRIERKGDSIYYKHNDLIAAQILVDPNEDLMIDVNLLVKDIKLYDFRCSFTTKQIELTFDVTNVTEGNNDGAVDLTVTGGEGNYTYSWSPGGMTTQDISNLSAGIYTVTVMDDSSNTIVRQIAVGYDITWGGLVQATTSADTLIKTSGSNNYNSGAHSLDTLKGGKNGWIEHIIQDHDTKFIGLSIPPANSTDYQSMDYTFYIKNDLSVYELGTSKWNTHIVNIGDIVRIERINDSIYYLLNSEIVRTVAVNANEELVVDAALYTGNMQLTNLSFSFIQNNGTLTLPDILDLDTNLNWSYSRTYDRSGKVASESLNYMDNLGRTTQSQTRDINTLEIYASQTLYDAFGRAGLQTLPAPIDRQAFGYKDSFFLTNTNNYYDYTDFTGDKLYDPVTPANNKKGTLGYYYSNNNIEQPYQANTDYPFTTVDYAEEPGSNIRKSGGAGEQMRLGSGNEGFAINIVSGSELETAFGENKGYYVSVDTADRLNPNHVTEYFSERGIIATKTVSINADGLSTISYSANGLDIATCMSGLDTATTLEEVIHMISHEVPTIDIHIPASKKDDVILVLKDVVEYPIPGPPGGPNFYTVNISDVEVYIYDLTTDTALTVGTDYTLAGNGKITFLNDHADNVGFYKVSVNYTDNFIDWMDTYNYGQFFDHIASINYDLDYTRWATNHYDYSGTLRKTVSPGGTESTFDYDQYGNTISKKTTDEGITHYVFDKEHKLRFSQNAQQKLDDKFSYTHYDRDDRVVEVGEFDQSQGNIKFQNYYGIPSLDSINTSVLDIADNLDELENFYCNNQIITLYDQLGSDTLANDFIYKQYYSPDHLDNRIAKSYNDHEATWYSYDVEGRVTFIVQQMLSFPAEAIAAGKHYKTLDYTYDTVGNLYTATYQQHDTTEKISYKYIYDLNNRLIKVDMAIGNEDYSKLASYEYYPMGGVKRVELGNNLQAMDYVYMLDGTLKSVNHPTLIDSLDPGKDGIAGGDHAHFTPDLFGMTLDYYPNDYIRAGTNIISTASDNYQMGLIDRVRTKTRSANNILHQGTDTVLIKNVQQQTMQVYSYDSLFRLKQSLFGVYDNVTQQTSLREEYKLSGLKYDFDGNILTLNRNDHLHDINLGYIMDSLSYTYTANSNRLSNVSDVLDSIAAYDYHTQAGTAFTYNAIGQMTKNEAERIDTVMYTPYGKVEKMIFDNGDYTAYTYSDKGSIHSSTYHQAINNAYKYTYYVTDQNGNVLGIYEKDMLASDTNLTLTTQPVYASSRVGVLDREYDELTYEITDHLGNVKATFMDSAGTAKLTSWKDYYPGGGVMPGRNWNANTYRYGYQGQEKVAGMDEVNGWDNFELRMWNSSIVRWMSPDPYGQFASAYIGMGNNPVNGRDPDGGYYNPGGHNVAVDLRRVYTGGNIEDVRWVNVAGKGYNPYGQNRAETRLEARYRLILEWRRDLQKIRSRSIGMSGINSQKWYNHYYGNDGPGFLENTKQLEEAVRAVEMKYQGAISGLGFGDGGLLNESTGLDAYNSSMIDGLYQNMMNTIQGNSDFIMAGGLESPMNFADPVLSDAAKAAIANPWSVIGRGDRSIDPYLLACDGCGETSSMPTKEYGGLLSGGFENFYNYMVGQANNNPVEVAAFELNDGKFFVQPWELNDATTSFNDYSYLPNNYNSKNVLSQFHTHSSSTGPSYADALMSRKLQIAVHSVGADGSIWKVGPIPVNGIPIRYMGFDGYGSYGRRIR